jgi:hypothetical protein
VIDVIEHPPVLRRRPLVASECRRVGVVAMVVVVVGILTRSADVRYHMYWHSDAPFFYAIARHPFARGAVSAHPLVFGVAYRYGRILYPLTAWLLALGRPSWVPGTLLGVYVVSFGAWFTFAAEHLRRNGRRPWLALWMFALPFCLRGFVQPVMVSEPMVGALLLLVYLFERDGRRRAVLVTAALLVLTREPMLLAMLPLVWKGWNERRWAAIREWALAGAPYVLWLVWVRIRVGEFPFLDRAMSRRDALAPPFLGYARIWHEGLDAGRWWGVVVTLLTLVVAIVVARRGLWRYPLTHGVVVLAVLIPLLGVAVFRHPIEAFRVVAPMQALLVILLLDRHPAPV